MTRILINVNEQITATMMEKHFQASSLQATVTATPKDMMPEILRGCRIDVVAYYAEQVDNNELLSFFNEIKAINPNIRCILFLKKENLNMLGETLENYLDECITIPLDSSDFMIRLRRMIRAIEQKSNQPEEQNVPQTPPQTPASIFPPEHTSTPVEMWPPQYAPQASASFYPPEQTSVPVEMPTPQNTPQASAGIFPPAQISTPVDMPIQQPIGQFAPQGNVEQRQPAFEPTPGNAAKPAETAFAAADGTVYTRPIDTNYSYAPENYQQPVPAQTVVLAPPDAPQYQAAANSGSAPLSVNNQAQNTRDFQANPFRPTQNDLTEPQKVNTPQKAAKKKQSTVNKVFGIISKVVFGIFILVVAVTAIFMVESKFSSGTPSVAGYQLYGVLSGSMNGTNKTSFNTGSIVFVKYKDPKSIVKGDIITFKGISTDSPLTTHRVVKVNNDGGKLTFTTKGDANNVPDPNPVSAERVVGTVRGHIPFIGYLTEFAKTKPGLIFLIFIPGSLVIIYELVNVFKTVKTERKKEKMTDR